MLSKLSRKPILSLAALALIVAACGESTTPPPTSPVAPNGPNLAAIDPFNSLGNCLAADVAAAPAGFDDPSLATGHCTANDIRIATADVIEYSFNGTDFFPFDPANPISCVETQPLFLRINAHVKETATSERTDIGVWIAQDGGNARTGSCNQYNLAPAPTQGTVVAGVSNIDGDQCGDMNNAGEAILELGVINAVCQTSGAVGASLLHIGSCLGWTQPGGDQVCPLATVPGPNGFRFGTIPGTSSKCNCEGFDVPITVLQVAQIKVVKTCDPTNDPGTFDLNIDGSFSNTAGTFGDNKACGTDTDFQEVGAGTTAAPGADHTVSESGFSIAPSNYTSTVSCTKNGAAYIASQAYTSPNNVNVHVAPDDQIVCTFVNTRKGSITIVKDAIPDAAVDFPFTTTGTGLSNFSLDDDADATLSNTTTFSGLNPGSFSVLEGTVSGWQLTGLTCSGGGANTTTSLATRTATIGLDAGENITCTYTNTKLGSLTVIKDAIPNNAQDFAYTTTGGLSPSSFNLDDDADGTLSNTQTFTGLLPGNFTVVEGANPSGWALTNLTCTGGGANTTTSVATRTATIGLDAGENITCTFENTAGASLTIIKDAIPNSAQDFAYTSTGGLSPSSFTLDDDADATETNTRTYSNILPGAYSVTEGAVGGWSLTNLTCTGGGANTSTALATRTATIGLDPGENVTCTFENTKLSTLTIIKDAIPNDAQDFAYTTTGTGLSNFNLDDDADPTLSNTQVFNNLAAGSYTVAEGAVAGWQLTGLTCVGGGANTTTSLATRTASIGFDPGEDVTCTFENTKLATVTIIKDDQNPATDPEDFAFTTTGTGFSNFNLDDDADATLSNTQVFNNLLPGARTVAEGAEANFDLTAITCVGGGANTTTSLATRTASIGVDAGESITCTFVNQRKARLRVQKLFSPANLTFDFTRNPGGVSFSLVDQQINDSGFSLAPATYRVCELNNAVTFSATATLDGAPATLVNPDLPADNGNRCVDVTLAYGGDRIVVFTNNPPPGGDARTIGYWKNWSSCAQSNGKQFTKATAPGGVGIGKTLDGNLPQLIGNLNVNTCPIAVAILDKSDVVTGVKRASDPLYGLAAQFLAAKLNYSAGAQQCPAATTAMGQAQTLLVKYNFTGTGAYKASMTAADQTLANSLAAILDSYNNNTLACP